MDLRNAIQKRAADEVAHRYAPQKKGGSGTVAGCGCGWVHPVPTTAWVAKSLWEAHQGGRHFIDMVEGGHQAQCVCGWISDRRLSEEEAEEEGQEHVEGVI